MLRKILLGIAASATLTGAAAAADLSAMSWDQIVAQAKQEGQVTWLQWYFEDRFRPFVKTFEDKYGIKVTLPDVDNADTSLNKVMAEKDRNSGDVDVLSMGGAKGSAIDPAQFFVPSILSMMPEKDALTDHAEGADWKGYAVKFWGNQTGMAYDSSRVTFADLPQTLPELDAWIKANPGQLGFNFENGGAGPSFIQNVARNILGITKDSKPVENPDLTEVFKWFRDRQDQYVLTTSNNDSYARINSGEFELVAAWEDGIAGLIKSGEMSSNIKVYLPKWGMNGGGNVVAIPSNAPHPAAALLFISWLTSAETQTELNKNFGSAPANTNADDSYALIPNSQRAYATVWKGPLSDDQVVPAVIDNVFKN